MESFSLMLSGRTFQREGATYLKARWPYRFVLESLGPDQTATKPYPAPFLGEWSVDEGG